MEIQLYQHFIAILQGIISDIFSVLKVTIFPILDWYIF